MQLYNYVAGGEFPPRMPKGFNEYKFGHAEVVVFCLTGIEEEFHAHRIAIKLQTSSEFKGLVYTYAPTNRDFLKCADFFGISAFPSYVVISYHDFRRLLCVDYGLGRERYDLENFEDFYRMFYENERRYKFSRQDVPYKGLKCIIINGDKLQSLNLKDSDEEILNLARLFVRAKPLDVNPTVVITKIISEKALSHLRNKATPLIHGTEMIVLFTRPAWRHTEFEQSIYNGFIQFGAETDDVLVRVLYPSYLSDEYTKMVKEFKITRLPAAIIKENQKGRVIIKLERDFFECIPNLNKKIHFLISDIHRAIIGGHTKQAKRFVQQIRNNVDSEALTTSEIISVSGEKVLQVFPQSAFIIKELHGDIVSGDKVEGRKKEGQKGD